MWLCSKMLDKYRYSVINGARWWPLLNNPRAVNHQTCHQQVAAPQYSSLNSVKGFQLNNVWSDGQSFISFFSLIAYSHTLLSALWKPHVSYVVFLCFPPLYNIMFCCCLSVIRRLCSVYHHDLKVGIKTSSYFPPQSTCFVWDVCCLSASLKPPGTVMSNSTGYI